MKNDRTIFEKSQKGQRAFSLPKLASSFAKYQVPESLKRESELNLPEISELDLTRHFTALSKRNMGIDTAFYPLGSCTMKFNPRINEVCAAFPQFSKTHPLAPEVYVQGNLTIIHELIVQLCKVTGMHGGSLVCNAGAQGEFCGLQMIRAYHQSKGEDHRNEILVPDDAHGTNPASVTMSGYKAVSIRTNARGELCLEDLREKVSKNTAGLMLTNPNTLGLFNSSILDVAAILHAQGGLLYYDGANLNAILNVTRPGDMGFDVMHINLHKTFSTPHGGGGPGSGPVLCNAKLAPFLPLPRIAKNEGAYTIVNQAPGSIGRIASFYGNFSIYLRAYVYLKMHGHYGLRRIAEVAVLNANYLKKRLSELFTIPYMQPCMHEFVVQADRFLDRGIRALDIAKRLLDYGIHAPTMYFPLIVKECMLIEPTESESKQTLDHFIAVMQQIVEEIGRDPQILKEAPHNTYRSRLDEVRAAKNPIVKVSVKTVL